MGKLLVVYATWTGATRTVAEAIAESLSIAVREVDVLRAKQVKDMSQYYGVVVCSPIHMALVPGEIKRFIKTNRKLLAKLPVAYCIVCLAVTEDSEDNRKAQNEYVQKILNIAPEVKPNTDVALFGGVVLDNTPEFKRLFPMLKVPVRAMAEQPDFRNWQEIREWTEKIMPWFHKE